VLAAVPQHPAALLNKAKVHVALKQLEVHPSAAPAAASAAPCWRLLQLVRVQPASSRHHVLPAPPATRCLSLLVQEAQECLGLLAQEAALTADMAVLLEGHLLAAALAAGEVKEGAKLALLPALISPTAVAAPPLAPPQAAAAATGGAAAVKPASGFALGFFGKATPAAPAAAATGPNTPGASEASSSPQPPAAAAADGSKSAQRSGEASRQAAAAGSSSSASRPAGAGAAGAAAVTGVDPLNQLVARTDANQGGPAHAQLPLCCEGASLYRHISGCCGAPGGCLGLAPPPAPSPAPPRPAHLACLFLASAGVGLAVQMVNSGSCGEAVALLDLLLQVPPASLPKCLPFFLPRPCVLCAVAVAMPAPECSLCQRQRCPDWNCA
jgi:hypothetical protein